MHLKHQIINNIFKLFNMDTTTNFSLMALIISTLLLYVIGLIAMVQSIMKYKYSKFWFALALILFFCPPLIFILISLCEKAEIRRKSSSFAFLKAKIKVNISVAIFIFYYSLYPMFVIFLKYTAVNNDWYKEIAMVCVNIVMLAFIPLYLFVNKKINTVNTETKGI